MTRLIFIKDGEVFQRMINDAPTIEQPDGDTISRQDAIAYFFRPYSNEELYSNIDIEKALNALQSAPDSRQRGEWVPNHIPDSMLCECDQCGFDCGAYTFNFCPNCGARMYKGGEEE